MEYIPKLLAQKFKVFEGVSILKFLFLFFLAFIVIAIISNSIGGVISGLLTSFGLACMLTVFAGFISTQHFTRKPWNPTSPIVVQFSSKTWFNNCLSLLAALRRYGELTFINLLVVMSVIVVTLSILQFGS